MKELINNLNKYKISIIGAIKDKYKEINSGKELIIDEENKLNRYAEYIKDYLTPDFEDYFTGIGYAGIPEELLLTIQEQVKYNETGSNKAFKYALFIGSDYTGDLSTNRRCILLFTDSLSGSHRFNNLRSVQNVYTLKDLNVSELTSVENLKESIINPYWFFRGSRNIIHIYGILDMNNIGYTQLKTGTISEGDYFFSGFLKEGNVAKTAEVPYLETLYMKNIHRAYNFGNSPLSMDSVLYCINNALYDAEYAEKEKTDEKEGTYKFTLKSSAYSDEQKKEIADAVTNRAAALGGNGLNMEIVFV